MTEEIKQTDDEIQKSVIGKFIEGVKKVAVVFSIGLAALLGILGLILIFLAWMRRVKVLNNFNTDEYDDDNFKVVHKTFIRNEDSNFLQDLMNELLGREEYPNWKVNIPERVINDEITREYKVRVSKRFAKKHNGEDLMIVAMTDTEELNIPITIFEEQTEYEFRSDRN